MKLREYRSKLLHTEMGWWPYLEVLVITVLVIGLTYLFNRNDPFCLDASFPWIWIAPVLISLRYGTFIALIVIVVMISAFFGIDPKITIAGSTYRYATLGGILLTVFCGEFSNAWIGSMKRFAQLNSYTQKRLDTLNRAFYLLRISHDRLEQSLISKPITLRDTFAELKKMLVEARNKVTEEVAAQLLNILGQYCSMEQAALYLYKDGKFAKTPIAHIGAKRGELDVNDPIVKECLESESGINYYAVNQLYRKDRKSKYLAAVLLQTYDKKIFGILVIEDFSFWSLTEEILRVVGIVLSYFADNLWVVRDMSKFFEVYPDCPTQFAFDLYNMQRLHQNFGINSALSAFVIAKSARQKNIVAQLQHVRRSLDIDWYYQQKDRDILFILMPFASAATVVGFRDRFQKYLKNEFGIDIAEGKEVYFRSLQIFAGEPLDVIKQMMEYTS
jgi:hypothetical protein